MRRFTRDISLRYKITLAFIMLVVGGTAISTYIGSHIITRAVLEEAQKRVRTGLETARMMLQLRLDRVRRSVVRSAISEKVLGAMLTSSPRNLPAALSSLRTQNGLDFLSFVDLHGQLVTSSGKRGAGPPAGPLSRLIRAARSGQIVACHELLDLETLAREGDLLATRARLRIVEGSRDRSAHSKWLKQGLVLASAEPVYLEQKLAGVVYGGVLLNQNTEVVEQTLRAVFGHETFQGRKVGTVSVFLGDVRISSHEWIHGTRVSPEVAREVLRGGRPWFGRAFVVNDWYVTAYEPIRSYSGRVIGMLGLGVQEAPYLELRSRVMVTFLFVAGLGVIIVFGLTYVITRTMILPLEEMVAATKKISTGDFSQTVQVTSGDEIGILADSFNVMMASLSRARGELEQWTHTLEDKVKERTEELVHVQSKMAEAEKLASLGRMAAGVAHEINNPMGGILTFAMLGLQDLPPDHSQRRNFEIIVKQTMRCRDIVKGLLEFSRQSESKPALTDINEVLDRTLLLLQQQASFQNIRTRRMLRGALPKIHIDPGHMQQVLLNLVVNAVDAMEESGELTVISEVSEDAEEILVKVGDTGKGIPREILPLIFEPFFTTKEVGRGTGLGLAIVHGIVTRAGGRVEVDTSPSGTTFTVRLPVTRPGPSLEPEESVSH